MVASIVDLSVFWEPGSITITNVLYDIHLFQSNKYLLLFFFFFLTFTPRKCVNAPLELNLTTSELWFGQEQEGILP